MNYIGLKTLGAPIISALMFFLIFGEAVDGRLGDIQGIPYPAFIMPGLVMMNILTTAFQGVVAPLSYAEVAAGFLVASVIRSAIVGSLIFATGLIFIPVQIHHPIFLTIFTILVSLTFSSFGFVAGLWTKNFEQLSIISPFIIMPLSFLGGVFYSADMLPPIARALSIYNPVFYMVICPRAGRRLTNPRLATPAGRL